MRVTFWKAGKRELCAWEAVRRGRIRVPGPLMPAGRDLPHDLAQYVVEAAIGRVHGFWGVIDLGATFKSTGRKRTRPGRRVIHDHVAALDATEAIVGRHLTAWRQGAGDPALGDLLDTALTQWRALGEGDRLVFEWPSPEGRVERYSCNRNYLRSDPCLLSPPTR